LVRRLKMDQKQIAPEKELTTRFPVLYVAFELGNSTWKMACSDGRKVRQVTVTARDLEQVQGALLRAQIHFGMAETSAVVSCYEAGRDGFWLHRFLRGQGIDNVVVDSASLEVDRRLRRAKTDRIDAGKLLRMLIRYHGGEPQLWGWYGCPAGKTRTPDIFTGNWKASNESAAGTATGSMAF
jgi:transposase